MTNAAAGLDEMLRAAGAAWDRPEEAKALLDRALAEHPDAEDAFVAAYRFHFYRNELVPALSLAERCAERALGDLGLPPDLDALQPDGTDFSDPARPRHRFLLFALHARAYLLARLGWHEDADAAFSVVARLDPADRIGAAHWQGVLRRGPDADAD